MGGRARECSKKRGRPKKNEAMKNQFCVKLNDKRVERLVYMMEELDMAPSQVFRLALDRLYNEMNY